MPRIQMGQRVRDLTTGIEGLAVVIGEELNGNRRITIQQKAREDGAMIDAYDHDEAAVDYVDDGIMDRVVPVPAGSVKINLGEKVEDLATGMTGTTTQKLTYLNGCVRFLVTGAVNRNGENTIAQIDHARLKLIKPVKALTETPKTFTGGPISRLLKMRRA